MKKDLQSLRVLITGATGFLGYYTLREGLKRDISQISALHREGSNSTWLKALNKSKKFLVKPIEYFSEEMQELVNASDVLIHCAAQISKSGSDLIKSNVELTEEIVNMCLIGNTRLIHISSVATLDRYKSNKNNSLLITEDDRLNSYDQLTPYAFSKYSAENEIWRGMAEGLDALILNPSQIIGLGLPENPNTVLWQRIKGQNRYYPQGGLGLVDVRDVAEAIWKAVESNRSSERIIISAENWTYKDFFNTFRKALNLSEITKPLSDFMHDRGSVFFAIYSLLRWKPHRYTSSYLKQLKQNFRYDNKKSKEILEMKYRSIRKSLEEIAQNFDRERPLN